MSTKPATPTSNVFSRRRALAALAAIPVTLPLAQSLHAESTGAPAPKRLVILMQNNGTQQANFWPDGDKSSPILDSLFKDPNTGGDNGLKAKTTLVKGVYMPPDANGTNGNEHDMGFARMFTGEKLISVGGQPWGGGISADQMLARDWGVETLTMAVLASAVEPHPKPGFDHRHSFSYLGPATLKYARTDPLDAYRYLFSTSAKGGLDVARRLQLRQSVLDATSGNLSEISARLGPAERHKLDYHLTAIRDIERRLQDTASCGTTLAPPPDYLALDPNAELNEDTYIPQLVDNMIGLAVMALKCSMTRIASVQFGYGGGKWRFAWKGIDMNCHDDVAHLDIGDAGSSPENTARLVLVNQYYASCVAKLATGLNAVPEGDGTMLDNTLLVWANEFGRGDHSMQNVPTVLIGRAAGALPAGGRVIDKGPQVFNRLGCTILNLLGHSAPGFGDVPDCGAFDGL
jgi:hypothetical protein